MKYRLKIGVAALALILIPSFVPSVRQQSQASEPVSAAKSQPDKKHKVVYVCACLNNKSCSCITEAMTEGPCACGPNGGPPMKEVPANSDWAKQNRAALAQ